jgi:hypothetical protein
VQRWVWAIAGGAICIFALRKSAPDSEAPAKQAVGGKTRWQWWLLPAISSAMLLATTNRLSYETSAGPLTWSLPLALFLGTYIWAFSADRMHQSRLVIILGIAAMIAQAGLVAVGMVRSWELMVAILMSGAAVMAICHAVLASTRSADAHRFYVANAVGGMVGSALMVIAVPRLLPDPIEFGVLTLGVLAAAAMFRKTLLERFYLTTLAVIAIGSTIAVRSKHYEGQIACSRSLYACLRVIKSPDCEIYSLVSNTTVHGREDRDHPLREMTYYGQGSGLGQAIAQKHQAGGNLNVGVIGLGTGTINRLLQPGDTISYFEINPQVEQMARQFFTYLQTPPTRVVIGDGRKCLEKEADGQYDVLVLDAFTGDAIPSHLLTAEAGRVCRRCLKRDGILAVHFTNGHVDLSPVIAGLARGMGMSMEVIATEKVDWAILRPGGVPPSGKVIEWTDERNSILPILKAPTL